MNEHKSKMEELVTKIDYLIYDDYHGYVFMNDNISKCFHALIDAIKDEGENPTSL